MPRPVANRKNLSEGWKTIYKLWKLPLEEKIAIAKKTLIERLKNKNNPVLCWSGGKDSTVALHLTIQLFPNIPIIYVNTGVDFPETTEYIEKITSDWNLNTIIAKSNSDFWDIGNRYGWPIFGKNIASNVERARRSGNIRPQLSDFEKKLIDLDCKISSKCAQILNETPGKEKEKELSADLKIIGIRAEESRARVRLWVDHGDFYYIKRYHKRDHGIWKLSPVSIWTEQDIWKYINSRGIPTCKLYELGYPRNGCWTCAMAAKNGQLLRLKQYHPHLYNRLIHKSPMGYELVKIQNLLNEGSLKKYFNGKKAII